MAPPLIVRAVLDAASYLKVSESVVSSNTLMGESALGMGAEFTKSAQAQVAAGVKVIQSQRLQIAEYARLEAASVAGSDAAIVAGANRVKAQAALNRSLGITAVATRGVSGASKEAGHDLGKLSRGALAGSGLFAKLGRSLAFASSGFIAVAGGATLIAESVRQAEALQVAQRQVDRQLQTSGKSWAQYGDRIDSVLLKEGHLAGFTRADLLKAFGFLLRVGGNVGRSLDLTALAADVARGRYISLQAASIALSKALGGSVTGLRRLGIVVPHNVTRLQALEFVTRKFAGQAEAGTSASQRFSAALTDFGATAGTALLPTFERLTRRFGDWLQRMNESGKLTRDVHTAVSILGVAFHTLGGAISIVDKITGGFSHTLLFLGEVWAGIKIVGWIGSLRTLASTWTLVATSATAAAEAEAAATAGGVATGAGRGRGGGGGGGIGGGIGGILAGLGLGRLFGRGATGVASRVGMYTGAGAAAGAEAGLSATGVGALAVASVLAAQALTQLAKTTGDKLGAGSTYDKTLGAIEGFFTGGLGGNAAFSPLHSVFGAVLHGHVPFSQALQGTFGGRDSKSVAKQKTELVASEQKITDYMNGITELLDAEKQITDYMAGRAKGRDPVQWAAYSLNVTEQIAQARASLTRGAQDDVAAAKKVIARIKRAIAHGNLRGGPLVQALQAEAAALGVIWAAEDSAAQKRASAAQAAKDKIITQIQNAIDPINLQIALAKSESLGQNTLPVLKQQLAAAYNGLAKAIANGNKQLILQAYEQIKSVKDAIKSALSAATATFTISPKLALDIARDQALGKGIADDLREEKKALFKWIRSHRKNIQGVTDAYNQIAAINSQLNSDVGNAYGKYKKASLKWETQGLGLTPDQRRALEARLSQIGPGGTHPMSGTGAAGFIIDPDTGRPIDRRHRRRGSQYAGAGGTPTINAKFDLHIYLAGKEIEAYVTARQQHNNTRRPMQRRGPNAATR